MTIAEAIKTADIDRSDAELLIAFALGRERSWVIAHGDEKLPPERIGTIESLIERRKNREPVALITGSKEFYGRTFRVTKDTLIPRPATEAVVSDALAFLRNETPKTHEIDSGISAYCRRLQDRPAEAILDVGTGSGCIAITLSQEGVRLPIIAIDTSDAAVKVAIGNAKALGAPNVQFVKADGANVVRNFHVPFLLVSNPPYIPADTTLAPDVADYEPHSALFAGKEGLDVILPLLLAARNNTHCVGVVMEMRTEQVAAIHSM